MYDRQPHPIAVPLQPQDFGSYPVPEKSVAVAYILCFFFGWFGIHQFYLGKNGRGLGYLLTFAWIGVGWLIDLFTLPEQIKRANFERQVGLR